MKSLKNFLAFLIPLLSMLVTFSIYLLITNVVNGYKEKIANDYSIVIVANTPIIEDKFSSISGIDVNRIEALEKEKIINTIKSNLSKTSIDLLEKKLPFFYQIFLDEFPTTSELNAINNELKKNRNIRNVEIFSKDHNQIYLLLLLLNSISFILFFIITIFAIIILAKQIKLWFHEHRTRITILRLHGASIIYSASSIINYAIMSSLLAFVVVAGFYYYTINNLGVLFPVELQDILVVEIDYVFDIIKMFLLSFLISICTIFGVLFKYKIDNE